MSLETKTKEDVEEWLIEKIAEVTKKSASDIETDVQLIDYGINSVDAVRLSGDLEDWVGSELPASIVFQYPTISALAEYLSEEF